MRKWSLLLVVTMLVSCAPSLRMHAVDVIGRRTLLVQEVAEDLEKKLKATKIVEAPPTDVVDETVPTITPKPEPPMTREQLERAVAVILYETQEIMGWIPPLRKDVGPVPKEKQLKLDTPKEQDTRFNYNVRAGAKASRRARRKKFWAGVLSIPRKILEWTIKTIWKIIPWWVKLPVLAAFAAWALGTIIIYWSKVRAARAAVQGEAVIARFQQLVDSDAFAAAVDPEHNADLARVHEKQKKTAERRARKRQRRIEKGGR